MKISLLGIAIHTGFSMMVALPARAQSDQPVPIEFAVLELTCPDSSDHG
jgi:hypothetical protein